VGEGGRIREHALHAASTRPSCSARARIVSMNAAWICELTELTD
jgi:hypothetical protein